MKYIQIGALVLACLGTAIADEQFCTLPLRPYETGPLAPAKVTRCNRLVTHLCRRFCQDGTAAELCRICLDTSPGGVGPCGLRIGTAQDCCAAGIAVFTVSSAFPTIGQLTCACPAAPCSTTTTLPGKEH